MSRRPSLVGQLLDHAAAPDRDDPPEDWQFEGVDDRQFQWLIEAGLGPLLYHWTRDQPERVPPRWRNGLLGAYLTARLRHANLVDTASEVIDRCARERIRVTLLKGISTSEQFYPAPHLRPMADIDVLVAPECCQVLESALLARGYRKAQNYPDDNEQHHGPPLHHPTRDAWVEIHRSLFPRGDELSCSRAFTATNVDANCVAFAFHGMPALRLCDELQLIYIATSWMRDLTTSKIHPSFLPSLFDAIFLLRHRGDTLDWTRLLQWTDDDMVTASLHVLLSFLAARDCVDLSSAVARSVAKRQKLVGPLQLRAILAMLDLYLIGGRPWHYILPPPVAGRYSLRRQWAKRIVRRPCDRPHR